MKKLKIIYLWREQLPTEEKDFKDFSSNYVSALKSLRVQLDLHAKEKAGHLLKLLGNNRIKRLYLR